jgi:hypothetical protein
VPPPRDDGPSNPVSAVPQDLLNYSRVGAEHARTLLGTGKRVSQDLGAFAGSHPDPALIRGIPDLGGRLQAFSRGKQTTDEWVGEVGQAFLNIEIMTYGPGWNDLSPVAMTDASELDWQIRHDDEAATQGRDLADRMRKALAARDVDTVEKLQQELAANQWDPAYTASFFMELGPENTLQAMRPIYDDPDKLAAYDRALATATSSPLWDPAFTRRLFDWKAHMSNDLEGMGFRTLLTELLLKDGTYSEDFLTQAGDAFFYSPHTPAVGPPGGRDQVFSIFLHALQKNPHADFDYLTGERDGQHRVTHLLELSGSAASMDPDAGRALGEAIRIAGFEAPQALDGHQRLLQYVSEADPFDVADGARDGVADLITIYVDEFKHAHLNADGSHELSWQAKLFRVAELGEDGEVDQETYRKIQGAILEWSRWNMPDSLNVPQDRWADYANQLGNMEALSLLPLSNAVYHSAEEKRELVNLGALALSQVPELAGDVPEPLEPVVKVLGLVWEHGVDQARTSISDRIQHDANIKDRDLYVSTVANFNMAIVENAMLKDPGFIPRSVMQQAATDPQALGRFLGRLAAAEDTNDLSGLPEFQGDPAALAKAKDLVGDLEDERSRIKDAFMGYNND